MDRAELVRLTHLLRVSGFVSSYPTNTSAWSLHPRTRGKVTRRFSMPKSTTSTAAIPSQPNNAPTDGS